MQDPLLFEMLSTMYFKTNDPGNGAPADTVLTVPGFALATGFTSTKDIAQTLTAYQEGTSQYPEESMRFLLRALTQLEDYYLQKGMMNKFPAPLVKFCLGAYHDVKDTNSNNDKIAPNANIMVVFNDPQTQQLPQQQAKEIANQQPIIEYNAI